MTLPTNTLLSICQQVARNLGAYRSGTTTALGSTTSLISAAYPYKTSRVGASSMLFEGVEIRPTSGVEIGNSRMVDSWSPSTGTFNVGVAWATAIASAVTFDMYLRGIEYSMIKDAVNKALRERYKLDILPLTLVVDGNAELSTTTSWSAAIVPASTLSKVTTAGNVVHGAQSLRIVADNCDSGYLYQDFYVKPSTAYIMYAIGKALDGYMRFRIYDNTNAAYIANADKTIDEFVMTRHGYMFTVPDTCTSIRIRIDIDDDVVGVSDNNLYLDDVVLLEYGATRLVLPDDVSFPEQIRGVYYDMYCSDDEPISVMQLVPYRHWTIEPNQSSAANLYNLVVDPPVSSPIYIELAAPYAELSTDTATTTMNRQLIETAATVELLQVLKSRTPDQEAIQWAALQNEWEKKLNILERLHPSPVSLRIMFDSPVDSPNPEFGGSS